MEVGFAKHNLGLAENRMAVLQCTAIFSIPDEEYVEQKEFNLYSSLYSPLPLPLQASLNALESSSFRNRNAVSLLLAETRDTLLKNVPGLLSFEIAYGEGGMCVVQDAYGSVAALAASKPFSVSGHSARHSDFTPIAVLLVEIRSSLTMVCDEYLGCRFILSGARVHEGHLHDFDQNIHYNGHCLRDRRAKSRPFIDDDESNAFCERGILNLLCC